MGITLQNNCIGTGPLIETGPLNDAGSNPASEFLTLHLFFSNKSALLIDLKINIFVVILM